MIKRSDVVYTFGMLCAVLMIAFFIGCNEQTNEIPITTQSQEARAIFIEARDLADHLRLAETREYLDKAIKLDSNFALAHLYRAYAFTSNEDLTIHLKKAIALMDKVSEGEQLLIKQSRAYYFNNNLDEQFELRLQLLQKYPGDKRVRNILGTAYYSRDEDAKAIAQLEAAITLDKNYPPPYNQLGYAYKEIGEYEKAEQAFKDYIRLVPDEPNPYDSMGDLYMKLGRFEEAIVDYQKAVDLDPVFTVSQRNIGKCLIFMGQYDAGREAYLKATGMELTPWGQLVDKDLIVRSYLYQGDYLKSIEATEQVIVAGTEADLPSWIPYVHLMKSRIFSEAQDLTSADQCLIDYHQSIEGAALTKSTMDYYARLVLGIEGRIAAKRQDSELAMEKAEQFRSMLEARKDPNMIENYNGLLAMIHFDLDDYGKALESFELSNQENPYTLYYHGVAQAKAGSEVRAQELFTKAVNWNEDSYGFAFIRAKALADMGVEL